jgi:hypothetical protein
MMSPREKEVDESLVQSDAPFQQLRQRRIFRPPPSLLNLSVFALKPAQKSKPRPIHINSTVTTSTSRTTQQPPDLPVHAQRISLPIQSIIAELTRTLMAKSKELSEITTERSSTTMHFPDILRTASSQDSISSNFVLEIFEKSKYSESKEKIENVTDSNRGLVVETTPPSITVTIEPSSELANFGKEVFDQIQDAVISNMVAGSTIQPIMNSADTVSPASLNYYKYDVGNSSGVNNLHDMEINVVYGPLSLGSLPPLVLTTESVTNAFVEDTSSMVALEITTYKPIMGSFPKTAGES